jgi:hypothetical protein
MARTVSNASATIVALALIAPLQSCTAFAPALHSSKIQSGSLSTTQLFDKQPFFAKETESSSSEDATPAPVSASQAVLDEASNALTSVGWAVPSTSEEMTSEDPFVKQIDESIMQEMGVGLDELLNPAKVVNLERDLYNLRSELAALTNISTEDMNIFKATTEQCDGGGGGEEADAIRKKISKKEKDLVIESRAVFRGWLKNIFLGQAALSLGISWIMVTDPAILFGGFDWFSSVNSMDVSIKVLGFWWWWLFIVPSLRSRRPQGFEKKALDIAFLGTPLISILAPVATKDTAIIWAANFAVVAGSYAFSYLTFDDDDSSGGKDDPEWLKFVYKSLDFGSGRERGARS